jgi:dihydroorotase-like cyclic amidohydrolase
LKAISDLLYSGPTPWSSRWLFVWRAEDISIVEPERIFIFGAEESFSEGNVFPFDGWKFQGMAVLSMVGGRITFNEL